MQQASRVAVESSCVHAHAEHLGQVTRALLSCRRAAHDELSGQSSRGALVSRRCSVAAVRCCPFRVRKHGGTSGRGHHAGGGRLQCGVVLLAAASSYWLRAAHATRDDSYKGVPGVIGGTKWKVRSLDAVIAGENSSTLSAICKGC